MRIAAIDQGTKSTRVMVEHAGLRACRGVVDACGLDNQGESCLAWDGRTRDATEASRRADREAESLAGSGLPLDTYFSASKLAWLIENVPAVRAAAAPGRLRPLRDKAVHLPARAGIAAFPDLAPKRNGGLAALADPAGR